MQKINAKLELLQVLKDNNLELLKIDCSNSEGQMLKYLKEKNESSSDLISYYQEESKFYTSLDDLDFNYDSWGNDLQGIIYCRDNTTKKPIWLTRDSDECSSWWKINTIPEFYKFRGIISYGE